MSLCISGRLCKEAPNLVGRLELFYVLRPRNFARGGEIVELVAQRGRKVRENILLLKRKKNGSFIQCIMYKWCFI